MRLGELIEKLTVGDAEIFTSLGSLSHVASGNRKELTGRFYDDKAFWNAEVLCIGISARNALSVVIK